jgi:lipoprotein-releasing system permease protein
MGYHRGYRRGGLGRVAHPRDPAPPPGQDAMRLEWAISLRYFTSPRSEGAVSFVTGAAVLGVALGVMALVVAMAVMNGYQANLLRAMSGSLPHVSIHPLSEGDLDEARALVERLAPEDRPRTVAPYLTLETLVRRADAPAAPMQGVMVRGVDPQAEAQDPAFLGFLDDGAADWRALKPEERARRTADLLRRLGDRGRGAEVPVLLSRILADKLGVALGGRLTLLELPKARQGFSPLPGPVRLVVAGFVETGIITLDEALIVTQLEQLRRIAPGEKIEAALGLRLADPLAASRVAAELRQRVGRGSGMYIYSWLESNRGLFQVVRIQKVMLFLVLMLIVVIAFFGMVSSLVMLVSEKSREIAILKALGARDASIHRVFFHQGLLIGLLGTALGVALGLAICWLLAAFPIVNIPPGVYPGSDRIPVRVSLGDLAAVVAGAMLVCLAATQFPSRKAMKLLPVDGLRRG